MRDEYLEARRIIGRRIEVSSPLFPAEKREYLVCLSCGRSPRWEIPEGTPISPLDMAYRREAGENPECLICERTL